MFGIFALVARYLPIFRVLGIIIAFFSYVGYAYHKGVVAEQNRQTELALKEAKKHEKIHQKNNGLPCDVVHKRLSKWMR